MTEIMIAPGMTDGQIEDAVDKFRAAMCKHRTYVSAPVAQTVLGLPNVGMVLFATFLKHAEAISNHMVRTVMVQRGRSLEDALNATGCVQYTDPAVMESVPRGEEGAVEVVLFKPDFSAYPGMSASDEDLEQELVAQGLRLGGPRTAVAVYETDSSLMDGRPFGTHWKDADGNWCFLTLGRWRHGRRRIDVGRSVRKWNNGWWFVCVRM
jgi:hypothetical protein